MIIIKLFGVLCDSLISLYIVPKGAVSYNVSYKCRSEEDPRVNIKGYHAVKVLGVRYSCPPHGLSPVFFTLPKYSHTKVEEGKKEKETGLVPCTSGPLICN